ncbi:hypothetical protein EJB05_25959 [Eragrostis curvula]|uniref:Uncharacterized protein n=1 Tax=Eragrostis curvula TaxID=38414 RepID=A0A5J9UJL8_9POAL|nr:hypothetical protein EJB05_25959 [Eragrostis curvula]
MTKDAQKTAPGRSGSNVSSSSAAAAEMKKALLDKDGEESVANAQVQRKAWLPACCYHPLSYQFSRPGQSTGSSSNDATDRSAAAAPALPPIAPVDDSSPTDMPPAAGADTEPLLLPRGDGRWASVAALLPSAFCDMDFTMVVNVTSAILAVGAGIGELLIITGPKADSVCSPFEKALPAPVTAMANVLPLVAVVMAAVLCIVHCYPCAHPLCTASTLNLIQLYSIAVLGGWMAGCIGGIGGGDVFLGVLVFAVLATLTWAWLYKDQEGGRQDQDGDMEGAWH